MAKYCDSKVLELNWFNWIVADAVRILEPYRLAGILWTKIVGAVLDDRGKPIRRNGRPLDDPAYPIRLHCIGVGPGIFVVTDDGKISISYTDSMKVCDLPYEISPERLLGDTEFDPTVIEGQGYKREKPAEESWQLILEDIYKMCNGISKKFNMPSEDDRNELANDAVYQVIRKLKTKKLTYTPGKAPVFNLLTTTIHRCMYSALVRDQRRMRNAKAYADELKAQHV